MFDLFAKSNCTLPALPVAEPQPIPLHSVKIPPLPAAPHHAVVYARTANQHTVRLQIGESIVTLTFTGKSTENTRAKLVNLLSEAYTERVKKWQ